MSPLIDSTPTTARRLARGAAALAISVAFLTACGGSSPDDEAADNGAASSSTASSSAESSAPATGSGSSSAEDGQMQKLTATEADFTISLDGNDLSAGRYEITVVNDGDATHDLVVEKDGSDVAGTEEIPPGESATLMVTLDSGDYVFYCSIGAHRSMGMEIDVTVS